MGIFQIALIGAAFLCSLVAGFLFAFAIVTMPGIRSLNDREFIRALQVMDRVNDGATAMPSSRLKNSLD